MKAKVGPDRFDTVTLMNNLASIYQVAGKLDRALPLYEEALALRKAKLGAEHPGTVCSMSNLAVGYLAAGNVARALPLFEKTFALTMGKLGPNHPDSLTCMNNLAKAYKAAGKFDKALPLYEEAFAALKAKVGLNHADTLVSMNNLAACYHMAGKPDRAVLLWREHAKLWKSVSGADSLQYGTALVTFGLSLLNEKNWAEAETVVREALTIRKAKDVNGWKTYSAMSLLGEALFGQKKYAEAEPFLKTGYEGMDQRAETIPPIEKECLRRALDRLIELAEVTGRADDAKRWLDVKAKIAGASTQKSDMDKK